jgi:hypothetical protein
MYPIASTTVGAGGASGVTFSSIPQNFTHLQIRYIARSTNSGTNDYTFMQINGDTGDNYVRHYLQGNGSIIVSYGQTGLGINGIWAGQIPFASSTANVFGTGIIDILDYTNTNKNKTIRSIGGYDANGSGYVSLSSGFWLSTSAITSLILTFPNFAQYTTFSLYGISTSTATGA